MFKKKRTAASPKVNASTKKSKTSAATGDAGKIDDLFERYVDTTIEDDKIGPEGVEKFCADLGLDPEDKKILILAWKMRASQMGYFSRAEFQHGFAALKATTLDKLKKSLVLAEDELKDSYALQSFYDFAFKFCLTESRQKIIEIDTAKAMLALTLGGRPHVQQFLQFLDKQKDYKTINLDQWQSFGRFSQEVNVDCSNYDENQAWPLLLDQYVEWVKEGKK